MDGADIRKSASSGAPAAVGKLLLIYIGVPALCWAASFVSFHTPALANVRLGLPYAVIVAAAIVLGWAPALAGIITVAAAFHHYRSAPLGGYPAESRLLPLLVLLLVGAEIFALMWRAHAVERKLRVAMHELQENSEALLQAQRASGSAAWIYDSYEKVFRWYPGGPAVSGRPNPPQQSLASLLELVVEDDRPALLRALEHTAQTGDPLAVEYRVLWPNGDIHWCEARGNPARTDPRMWRGVTLDITERKRGEAVLIQTEKLAVAGRLAAAIAHEINNPLEAITNLCFLARNTGDEQTARYMAIAEDELRRVAQITSQTLRFHRQQSAATATDLNEVLESILTMYESRLSRTNITVALDMHPAPKLLCFAGEIRQVLANLIGNALDAMPGGGKLRIRMRPITTWRTGEPAVRITIGDTGHGIPKDTLDHIYEPFFTTKSDIGTGLGLWVSATLVEKHRGRLWVQSSTSPRRHGTVFSVVLPYGRTAPPEAMRYDAVPAQPSAG